MNFRIPLAMALAVCVFLFSASEGRSQAHPARNEDGSPMTIREQISRGARALRDDNIGHSKNCKPTKYIYHGNRELAPTPMGNGLQRRNFLSVYEFACEDGRGFIVEKEMLTAKSFRDCQNTAGYPFQCILAANTPHGAVVRPALQATTTTPCKPLVVVPVGAAGADRRHDRYEVVCEEPWGLLVARQSGNHPYYAWNCVASEGAALACRLTPETNRRWAEVLTAANYQKTNKPCPDPRLQWVARVSGVAGPPAQPTRDHYWLICKGVPSMLIRTDGRTVEEVRCDSLPEARRPRCATAPPPR